MQGGGARCPRPRARGVLLSTFLLGRRGAAAGRALSGGCKRSTRSCVAGAREHFMYRTLASLLAILCRFCVVPRSCAAPASLQLHQSASRTCRPRPIGAAAGVALTALAVFGSPWLRWAAIPPHPPRLSFPSISISVYRWFSGGFLVPTVYLTFQLLPSVGGERPGGCGPERGSDAGNKRGYSLSPSWQTYLGILSPAQGASTRCSVPPGRPLSGSRGRGRC